MITELYSVVDGDEVVGVAISEDAAQSFDPKEGRTIRMGGKETHYASDGTWWKWEDGQPGSGPASRKVGA